MKMCRCLVLIILLLSCGVSTSIVSIVDESYKKAEYSVIAVSAPYDDLEVRSYIEGLFQYVLASDRLKVYKAMELLPPLNPYSQDQFVQRMNENGIQTVLVVSVTDFWTTYYATPSETITETETSFGGTFSAWGDLFGIYTSGSVSGTGKTISRTRNFPGATLSQSNVKLDVRLFLLDTQKPPKTIWRANSTSSGDYFSDNSILMEEAAYKIGLKLERDGLIKQ